MYLRMHKNGFHIHINRKIHKNAKKPSVIYTETKKFSNIPQISIFITEVHVEINTRWIRIIFVVNAMTTLFNAKYCKISFVWSAVPVIKCFSKGQNINILNILCMLRRRFGWFWWTFTYQRQFLDVIKSVFAARNVTFLMWMKCSSSGVSF